MGKKSRVWNHYFKDKRRFADFFNGVFYSGEQRIRAKDLEDSSEVYEEVEGENPDTLERGERQERIRDIKMILRSEIQLRILALENQNLTDYTMPFRCMQYDTMEYSRQVEQLQRRNKTEKNFRNAAEKMCGFRKTDRLIPVYTACIYHGAEPWDGPKNLKDMMEFEENEDVLKEQFIDYPLRLYCVNEASDFSMFHTEIKLLFQMLQFQKDKQGLKRLLENNPDYERMDADTLEVVSVTLNAPSIWNERIKYMNVDGEKEEYNMCQALQDWAEEERGIGMQQGMQQGIQSLIEVCKSFGISWEEVSDALVEKFSIMKDEAEGYMKLYW